GVSAAIAGRPGEGEDRLARGRGRRRAEGLPGPGTCAGGARGVDHGTFVPALRPPCQAPGAAPPAVGHLAVPTAPSARASLARVDEAPPPAAEPAFDDAAEPATATDDDRLR